MEGTEIPAMLWGVETDRDTLVEQKHGRYVAMFVALLLGVAVAAARGAAALLARYVLPRFAGAA